MPSEDEFDNISDGFAGIDWNAVPSLCGTSTAPAGPSSPNSSTRYSVDDEFDDSFLAEVDAIEERATRALRSSTNASLGGS